MNNMEELKIWGICQNIKGNIDTLYGLIKCNPKLATQDVLDLAEGLYTAAGKARQVAYGLGDKELYRSVEESSNRLITLIEGE